MHYFSNHSGCCLFLPRWHLAWSYQIEYLLTNICRSNHYSYQHLKSILLLARAMLLTNHYRKWTHVYVKQPETTPCLDSTPQKPPAISEEVFASPILQTILRLHYKGAYGLFYNLFELLPWKQLQEQTSMNTWLVLRPAKSEEYFVYQEARGISYSWNSSWRPSSWYMLDWLKQPASCLDLP